MPKRKRSRSEPPHPAPVVAADDSQPSDDEQGREVEPVAAERSSKRIDEQGAALDAPQEAIEDSERREAAEQGDAPEVTVGPQEVDAPENET